MKNETSLKAQEYLEAFRLGVTENVEVIWYAQHIIGILEHYKRMEEALEPFTKCTNDCKAYPSCIHQRAKEARFFDPLKKS